MMFFFCSVRIKLFREESVGDELKLAEGDRHGKGKHGNNGMDCPYLKLCCIQPLFNLTVGADNPYVHVHTLKKIDAIYLIIILPVQSLFFKAQTLHCFILGGHVFDPQRFQPIRPRHHQHLMVPQNPRECRNSPVSLHISSDFFVTSLFSSLILFFLSFSLRLFPSFLSHLSLLTLVPHQPNLTHPPHTSSLNHTSSPHLLTSPSINPSPDCLSQSFLNSFISNLHVSAFPFHHSLHDSMLRVGPCLRNQNFNSQICHGEPLQDDDADICKFVDFIELGNPKSIVEILINNEIDSHKIFNWGVAQLQDNMPIILTDFYPFGSVYFPLACPILLHRKKYFFFWFLVYLSSLSRLNLKSVGLFSHSSETDLSGFLCVSLTTCPSVYISQTTQFTIGSWGIILTSIFIFFTHMTLCTAILFSHITAVIKWDLFDT
ncbi:hypothetical protein VP01_107g1 [Puccinia sorghi]|uniref:Uncharacterized protein n=1 Tax=Puccinia sorghi TaxID=27349 RepID=A0A0L6VTM9_9BASI|nr:hypothetical protein VP01_107g1 [Puccinia sorghi]